MTGIQPHWFIQVSLLGRRVYAHLVAVALPHVPDLPLGDGFTWHKQLWVHRVQIPLEGLTPGSNIMNSTNNQTQGHSL